MDKEYLINLTNEVYRLTLLFPKKEPLRYKMRDIADEILAHSVSNPKSIKELLRNLEIFDSFFWIAKRQNWVKPEELLDIQKEYSKIKDSLKPAPDKSEKIIIKELPVKVESQLVSDVEIIPNRKKKILEILKERGRIQVWEVKKILPEVTKRTIRRDFENLLRQGLIERIGERNNTSYRLLG